MAWHDGDCAMKYSYAYDPELDLWAIITPEGYTYSHETFKWKAVKRVKQLNAGLKLCAQHFSLDDFDPFHPRFEMDYDGSEQIVDEPMEDYDWEEWLSNE